MTRRGVVSGFSRTILIGLALAVPVAAQDRRGVVWDDRPSIVFGDDINVDLRMKLQLDWRTFDPEIDEDVFDFRNLRFGLKGELTKHVDYEIEREVSEDGEFTDWKDVYITWRTFDGLSVRGGRFKVPFGLEQNTGPTETDFAYRSLASSTIAPARDKGVMVFGRPFDRALTYEIGVFNGDGDNGKLTEPQFVPEGEPEPEVGPSLAGRVTVTPLSFLKGVGKLDRLRIGVAYTNAELPEGLNSLRGESLYGTEEFFEPVYVKGRRQRTGVELEWTPGSTGIKAEWMQAREDRREQSNRDRDISDVVSTGWYVSGTWIVTGEDKDSNINPRTPLFRGGAGAIELAVRYDTLGFASANQEGTPYSNPRADPLLGNTDSVWTFGVNWSPIRWVKVVANAAHEEFEDPRRSPEPGTSSYWSGLIRLQVVF